MYLCFDTRFNFSYFSLFLVCVCLHVFDWSCTPTITFLKQVFVADAAVVIIGHYFGKALLSLPHTHAPSFDLIMAENRNACRN